MKYQQKNSYKNIKYIMYHVSHSYCDVRSVTLKNKRDQVEWKLIE